VNLVEIAFTVVLGLIVNEASDVSPRMAVLVVRLAARVAYTTPELKDTRTEEWAAIVHDRPGKLLKLATSLGFLAGALLRRSRLGMAGIASRRLHVVLEWVARLTIARGRRLRLYELLLAGLVALGYRPAENWLARLYELQQRFLGAVAIYWYSTSRHNGVGWLRLGTLLEMLGRIDDAILVYRQATATPNAHLARAELARLTNERAVLSQRDQYRAILTPVLDTEQALLARSAEMLSEPAVARIIRAQRREGVTRLLLGEEWDARLHCALLHDLDGDLDRALAACLSTRQDVAARWRAYELLERHDLIPPEDRPLLQVTLVPHVESQPIPYGVRLIHTLRRTTARDAGNPSGVAETLPIHAPRR